MFKPSLKKWLRRRLDTTNLKWVLFSRLYDKFNALSLTEETTRLKWLLLQKRNEFKSDPNNKIDLVEKGFENHLEEAMDDTNLLTRIADSYNKAKENQRDKGQAFQVSNEWIPIYERHLGDVMRALRDRNIIKLSSIYSNFMRDTCSIGLHGMPFDMHRCYFGDTIALQYKLLFIFDSLHRYRLWHSLLGGTYPVTSLVSPWIGNPYGYFIDGVFIRAGADYLHYYAALISRLIKTDHHQVVVELGGGYGGMAYYIIRENPNLSYVDFDLPENMALSAYYLLKAFPNKKFLLYGEAELTADSISSYDIVLMPSFEISKLADNSCDLVFNSYSLAEMSFETIHTYISHISRITKKYFLHVNHNKNSLVVADDFGIDPNQFDLLYKIPALWNMGRNLQCDEYEYLYKKAPFD